MAQTVKTWRNLSQQVKGRKEMKHLVNDGLVSVWRPLVAEMKMERAKGFEPSTLTLAT